MSTFAAVHNQLGKFYKTICSIPATIIFAFLSDFYCVRKLLDSNINILVMRRNIFAPLALLAVLIFSTHIYGQKLQPVPMDTSIRYGKLSNGLTYYIRHNEEPKQRAEFYIAQNVGAILEEDPQNGLAHFLEHMAFNGTKHFPGKNLINYFETVGVRFGENINAYTSLDETVYNLSEVPTTREGIIDSALLVLHDWSNCILLEGSEIDKERGVIREEWRQGQTAERRLWKESNKVTMAGSKYAIRDIIGDTAVINNFSYKTLRDYYKKWYRPDLQAILIVGDVDVNLIESKIKSMFADIPAPVNPAKRIYYPVPDKDAPITGVFTDPEMQNIEIRIDYRTDALPDSTRLSIQGYENNIMNSLVSAMTSIRLQEITQEPGTPFASAESDITSVTRTKDSYIFYAEPVAGKEKEARARLLSEAESIRRFGFTQSELERAKSIISSRFEKYYNERTQQKNNQLVREYARNFLKAESIPGIAWEYNFIKEFLPGLSIEDVNKDAQSYLDSKNVVYAIYGPKKEGLTYPANEELIQEIADTRNLDLKPREDKSSNEPLISDSIRPGKVKKTSAGKVAGTTEWTLSNGIKVIFKPTKLKQDEIKLSAWSEGGKCLLPQEDLPSALYTIPIIEQGGLGNFNLIELNKKLSGKIANVQPGISNYKETLNGSSSVKDLETLFQLTYLYFTAPRKDDNAYDIFMKSTKTYLENQALDPNNSYYDSINVITTSHNPRVVLTNLETLSKVDYPTVMRIYKSRFENPADFTFLFVGNIDVNTFKPLVEKYLGGLKTTKDREKWRDDGVYIAKGRIYSEIKKKLQISKTSNYILYSADLPFNMKNRITMIAIGDILDLRYTATIREDEGASYSVGVYGGMSEKPKQIAYIGINFDTDPKLDKKMLDIVHSEIKSIADNGPKEEDLKKVQLNLLKKFNENQQENDWWLQAISDRYTKGLDYLKDYQECVKSLTSESIQKLAKYIVDQNNVAEILLMPE